MAQQQHEEAFVFDHDDDDDEDDDPMMMMPEVPDDDDGVDDEEDDAPAAAPRRPTAAAASSRQEEEDAALAATLARLRPAIAAGDDGPKRLMVLDVLVRRSASDGERTEALLIGRCDDGLSGCLCVHGWQPYLYVRAPHGWVGERPDLASQLRELLEARIATYMEFRRRPAALRAMMPRRAAAAAAAAGGGGGGKARKRAEAIHAIHVVTAKSIYGYSDDAPGPFLKIEVRAPYHLEALRDALVGYPLDAGGRARGVRLALVGGRPVLVEGAETETTFNSSIEPSQQFMVDVGLAGCQWLSLEGAALAVVPRDDPDRRSQCAHEWLLEDLRALRPLDLEGPHSDIGPLRVLSFDLEAAGRRGVFPQAAHDPVIQIALYFRVVGSGAPITPVLLCLRSCEPIAGADVLCFEDEGLLLRAFRDIADAFDADVFTGYNILNFDFPYLHDRAAALSDQPPREFPRLSPEETDDTASAAVVTHFDNLARVRGASLHLRETEYMSAQTGKRKRTRVTLVGRVCLDMLNAIQNSSHRLESYTLKACAEHFLDDHKIDLPFTQITPKWNEGPAGRRELGEYCLKDAELPMLLDGKVDALTQTIEMARATGVPFDAVLQRGIMVRNTSLLLRGALRRGFVFPNLSPLSRQPDAPAHAPAVGRSQNYKGATVLEPSCGVHKYVGVLDFASMYPRYYLSLLII